MNYSSFPLGPSAAAEESAEAETDGGGGWRSGSGVGACDLDTAHMTDKQEPGQAKHLPHLFFFVLFSPEIVLGVFQQLRTMRTHHSSLI